MGESCALKGVVFVIAAGLHLVVVTSYLTDTTNLGTTESPVISLQMNLQETKFLTPENPEKNAVTIPERNQTQASKRTERPSPKEPPEPEKPEPVRQSAKEPSQRPPIPLRKPLIRVSKPEPEKETPVREPEKIETARPPETSALPFKEADDDKTQQAESSAASAISMGQQQASPAQQENYAARLQRHIARHLPEGNGLSGRTVIVFMIDPDGRLLEIRVDEASHNPKVDQLALDTIKNAAPYPRPPANSTALQRTFAMPFDFRQTQ